MTDQQAQRAKWNRAYYQKRAQRPISFFVATAADEEPLLTPVEPLLPSVTTSPRKPFTVSIPEVLIARLNQISVDAKRHDRYVWKNTSHLAEDLLLAGMRALDKGEIPEISEAVEMLYLMRNNERTARHYEEARVALQRITGAIQAYQAIGADINALAHFWRSMDEIQLMEPNVWRDWLVRQLAQKFGRYLTQPKPGPSFRSKDAAVQVIYEAPPRKGQHPHD